MCDSCPKCGSPASGDSCYACGLIFKRFDPASLEANVPSQLKDLWSNAEKNWNDKAAHALFLERAITLSQAGYAAACYRRRGDDPMAARQLSYLTTLLEQTMTASTTKSSRQPRQRRGGMMLLMLLIISAALMGLFLAIKNV